MHKHFPEELDKLVPIRRRSSFFTEVKRLNSISATNSRNAKVDDIRPAAEAAEVLQLIDKMAEKKQRSIYVKTAMQKAVHKTILVVRTKNSIQAAEIVTVRFSPGNITEVPRSVHFSQINAKVMQHIRFVSRKRRSQFEKIFSDAREIDILLKDMFWYLTAHCFQPNRQPQLEVHFYQRIADTFTSLFVRLQMTPSSRDCGFFDQLPDVVAQIMFAALYEAFPRSRSSISTHEIRCEILRTCHCWILGFVPAVLKYDHWIPVDPDSPKQIAAHVDFPAMQNRKIRAERIERSRQAVKTWHDDQEEEQDDPTLSMSGEDSLNADQIFIKAYPSNSQAHHKSRRRTVLSMKNPSRPIGENTTMSSHVEIRERFTYEMCNSPLIGAFLARHQLEANTHHLRVQMRFTNGKQGDLNNQEALQTAVGVVPACRRRIVKPQNIRKCADATGTIWKCSAPHLFSSKRTSP